MDIVPYEFIELTQNQIDNMASKDAQIKMQEIYLGQPNLSEYIVAMNDDINDELNKYSLYIFSILYLSIKNFHQKNIKVIPDKTIIKIHESNVNLLDKLETSHEAFISQIAKTNFENQPGIYQFITKSIFDELKDIADVTEDEQGWIFLVLKSTIDALNKTIY